MDPSSEIEGVNTLISDSLSQLDGQPFQAEDEQIWGKGVPLADSLARYHLREGGAVPYNMKAGGGDHVHDEGNEGRRHLKKFKRFLDKGPLETIISFFKIQLKRHVPCSTATRN